MIQNNIFLSEKWFWN